MNKKPTPPEDMWEQIAELHSTAVGFVVPARPPDSFTLKEYSRRFKLTFSQASRVLNKLRVAGKVKMHGWGAGSYYILTGKK